MRRFLLFLLILAATAAPSAAQAPASAGASGDAGYYFLLARHLEKSDKIDEAITALRTAMSLEPRSAELRAQLAGLYARQDRAVEAMTAAEEALAIDPANSEANRTLGSIYAALSEQKQKIRPGDDPGTYAAKAIGFLERARSETRGDLGLEFSLGRLYMRAGQHEKAIAALGRVFEEQPEYAEGGLLLAAAQEDAGRVEDAIKTVELTLQVNPTFFRGYIKLIELYEEQRRWKDAARAYALAAQVNPQADLAGGHAAALLNAGEARQAQALLEPVIAKKPAEAGLLYLLAESQRRQKNYAAASATAQKLRAAFPDDTRSYVMEAQLHEQAGRVKEAEAAWRQLLERDPLDANALNSLGYLLADRGERLDEAVQLLERANKIEPGNPSFLDSLGWAFYKQGRLEKADGPLSEAAKKSPANSVIQDHLGDLRVRQQRFAEAVAAFERALAGDGEDLDRAAVEKKLRDARARIRTP